MQYIDNLALNCYFVNGSSLHFNCEKQMIANHPENKSSRAKLQDTPRRMSRNRIRSKERRQEVFESIARLLVDRRQGKMTLDDIAAGIGGTKGTIYYFFKSKGDMLYKMNMYAFELLEEAIDPILHDRCLSPGERLEQIVRLHTLVACRHWQLWRAILNEVTARETSSGGVRVLARKRTAYENSIKGLIGEMVQAEGWQQVDTGLVARFIIGVINSIVRWYRDGGKYTAEDMADYAVQCVFEGGFGKRI